jgi:hypothetical protein
MFVDREVMIGFFVLRLRGRAEKQIACGVSRRRDLLQLEFV